MKRTTKKLSGIGLELFLRRFYGTYREIDEKLAEQLSKDAAKAFASVRVRRIAWRDWRRQHRPVEASVTAPPNTLAEASLAKPRPAVSQKPAQPVLPEAGTLPDDAAFDPYAIGLVPVYQREGAEGLTKKLSSIGSIDNLRKMARSQQVALPAELRGSDADIEAVRTAIVTAVGKRIANRRAAAG